MSLLYITDGPIHVEEDEKGVDVLVETMLPGDWHQLEKSCQSSGGHLVSFGDAELERAIVENAGLTSFWCGGNMCPDSPGIML